MRNRDSSDALTAILAMLADAVTIWLAQMAAVWLRFDSGLFTLYYGRDTNLYGKYALAAAAVLPCYLLVFQVLKLYSRPQQGTFANKLPRLVRACIVGGLGVLVISALIRRLVEYSNGAILTSFVTVTAAVLLQRAAMFRLEFRLARRAAPCHRTLIVGAGEAAARLIAAIAQDPRLRTRVAGVLTFEGETPDDSIAPDLLCGRYDQLESVVAAREIDQLILTGHSLAHDEIVTLIIFCERHLVHFNMVPDLFRLLTSRMEFHTIKDIPLLGISRWPLDQFWNRFVKRATDIAGGLIGSLLSAVPLLAAAILIRLESPGPVFYIQERCGRRGRTFRLCKLRTMRVDAEACGAPGWTVPDDPRRTRVGAWLRRYNIDELPQFWNVLKGDMSLVGPRPERPYFVERFASGIEHYMWRHVSKPGLTGWAQVNGLRGDTSIAERVKYDLFYLENWSLAFDLKILIRTLFTRRNAC
ncbi:MAG: exopolysaccharide biosynthesis polyprenyl glycosylphosphotransferase [Kiritimatiellae bacterium]|nr:exopolysaccharide biosynthesis polyprenyl glycosylphosphotransferase [Kiritimatiellia bacterium]